MEIKAIEVSANDCDFGRSEFTSAFIDFLICQLRVPPNLINGTDGANYASIKAIESGGAE